MHDAVRVSILEGLQNFKSVQTDIHRIKLVVQLFGFYVWDVFEHQARRFRLRVTQHVVQLHNVGAAVQRMENFGLPINFLGSNWFQNLDNAGLVVADVHALEDLRVLSSA